MASQDNQTEYRVAAAVLLPIVVLTVCGVLGLGLYRARVALAPAVPVAQPAVLAPAQTLTAPPAPAANDASIVVENGVVKFYFAPGQADLAPGAVDALADAIAAAKAGKKLVISGFHDASGSAAANAELAKRRAQALRDALVRAGVAPNAVELKKPEVSTGSGSAAEARRVEVTIAP